jgi:hypothetical protein
MDSGIATRQRERGAANDDAGTAAEWTTLAGRMIEDLSRVIQLELQLMEVRITPSLTAMADRAIAGLVILFAGALSGSCLLAALILLLHQWMQWWECFAVGGAVGIACTLVAYASMKTTLAVTQTKTD